MKNPYSLFLLVLLHFSCYIQAKIRFVYEPEHKSFSKKIYSPNNKFICAINNDGICSILNIEKNCVTLTFEHVSRCWFSSDSRYIKIKLYNNRIIYFDLFQEREVFSLDKKDITFVSGYCHMTGL